MAMLVTALILFLGQLWRDTDTRYFFKTLGAGGFLLLVAGGYFKPIVVSPAASHNMYVQQYQMHRFATDYFAHPVAVNDLGLVSWRNDSFVLDLWGLGSEKARRFRSGETGPGPDEITELVAGRDVAYAMVYDHWFEEGLPPGWCHIATLETTKVTAGAADVQFHLVDPSRAAEMAAALDAFAPTLPPSASLERFDCPS